MSSDLQVGVGALSALAVVIVAALVYRVRRERSLEAQRDIVVPLGSEGKGVVILLLWIAVAAALYPFIRSLLKSYRSGSEGVFLLGLLLEFGICGLGFFSCMRLTRAWRRVGELRYTPDRLSLVVDGQQWSLDLRQQFELFEWAFSVGEGQALQAVVFRQGETVWGFTYPLAMTHRQFDNSPPVGGPRPMVGADARVIHERLRAWRPSGGRAWL